MEWISNTFFIKLKGILILSTNNTLLIYHFALEFIVYKALKSSFQSSIWFHRVLLLFYWMVESPSALGRMKLTFVASSSNKVNTAFLTDMVEKPPIPSKEHSLWSVFPFSVPVRAGRAEGSRQGADVVIEGKRLVITWWSKWAVLKWSPWTTSA